MKAKRNYPFTNFSLPRRCFWTSLPLIGAIASSLWGTTYYVSNSGNDSLTGTSPSQAWATLSKVGSFSFSPGDIVSFQAGGLWRGGLSTQSGDSTANITYTAYGSGNKPRFLGSTALNDSNEWLALGGNKWTNNRISNYSFDASLADWNLIFNTPASASFIRDTTNYVTAPGSCKITAGANIGTTKTDIQVYLDNMRIVAGSTYRLWFKAKATSSFTMYAPTLTKQSTPFNNYYSNALTWTGAVTTSWKIFYLDFTANTTATDARINFWLGNSLPANASLSIDEVMFQKTSTYLYYDIGNIYLNDGAAVGIKKSSLSALTLQNQFWYDADNNSVIVYSTTNPALAYSSIECALNKDIIYCGNYVTIDGLDVAEGGAHGISATNCRNVTIQNCKISYVGGSYLSGSTRYGNGIQFYNNARDSTVTGNVISDVYDVAITNQGSSLNQQFNLFYRDNTIQRCEQSFEIWDGPTGSDMHDIYFENNTCENAGGGWSHSQRSDPRGSHILLHSSDASASNLHIRYNVFKTSADECVARLGSTWVDLSNLEINYNQYFRSSGDFAVWNGSQYSTFVGYKGGTEKDSDSMLNNLLGNAAFSDDTLGWSFYASSGASASYIRDLSTFNSPPASCKVSVTSGGTSGSDVQLFVNNLSITNGKHYTLRFRAKCTTSFTMRTPTLIKQTTPFNSYYSNTLSWSGSVTSTWQTYLVEFIANTTASDARLDFWLGNSVPAGASLSIDDVDFGLTTYF